MKFSRLVSTLFVLITLGFASLSLTACQTADSGSSGASSSSGGSSGGY